jgi:type II secretory pathway pseudopilin PulG
VVAVKPLKVEFLPPRKVPGWVWHVGSVVLLAVAAHQGWQAWRAWQELRVKESQIADLRAKIEQARQAQREALERQRAVPPYAQDAAEIAKVAGFPIERVFASTESARVQGVKVTSLEMSAIEGVAKVDLEFADHDTLLRYLEAINAGEEKPRWRLVQAQLGSAGASNVASIASHWD